MKMNLNQELNKDTVNVLFSEYKSYLVPALSIVASVLIFIFLLLPQIFSISEKRKLANNETQKLDELKTAKDMAASADIAQITSQLSTAGSVLPSNKDFESIINTLSTVAAESGVTIQSYQFQDSAADSQASKYLSLDFTVDLFANPSQAMDFVNKLSEKAPLSQAQSISGTDTASSLLISFYYEPFSPVTDATNIQIRKMNPSETQALSTISQWNITTFEPSGTVATESAGGSQTPF